MTLPDTHHRTNSPMAIYMRLDISPAETWLDEVPAPDKLWTLLAFRRAKDGRRSPQASQDAPATSPEAQAAPSEGPAP